MTSPPLTTMTHTLRLKVKSESDSRLKAAVVATNQVCGSGRMRRVTRPALGDVAIFYILE